MQSYQAKSPPDHEPKSYLLPALILGGGAFFVGAVLSFGYVKWDAQQKQLALMSQQLEQLSQQQVASVQSREVTRTAPVDLLQVAPAPAVTAPIQVAAPAPQVATPTPTAQTVDPSLSTAEKLQLLTAAALDEPVTPTLSSQAIADARRLETLAVIHAGVQELVAAVVAGEYDIHTDYEDEHFSGRIHFAFVGHEKDQVELEKYLATAAEDGIVAHSASVVDGDGSVNGHILLFDLVERALENGTLEEQRAGQKMRREAVAMLAKDSPTPQVTNASGQNVYVVESGDSLAYIALQFYGNTNDYVRIFDANRSQLRTPDRIRVGQRLVIPNA